MGATKEWMGHTTHACDTKLVHDMIYVICILDAWGATIMSLQLCLSLYVNIQLHAPLFYPVPHTAPLEISNSCCNLSVYSQSQPPHTHIRQLLVRLADCFTIICFNYT